MNDHKAITEVILQMTDRDYERQRNQLINEADNFALKRIYAESEITGSKRQICRRYTAEYSRYFHMKMNILAFQTGLTTF